MVNNPFLILILFALLALLPLFRAFRPKGLRIGTLRFLKDGPKTVKQIAEHLKVTPQEASVVLYAMEHTTEEVECGVQTHWDDLGIRHQVEVFLITPMGEKKLKKENGRDKAISKINTDLERRIL